MKKEVFKYIERELYDYEDTKKAILDLKDEILHPYKTDDINKDIKGNATSSPTENTVIKIATHKQLNRMINTVRAIDKVVDKLDGELKELYILKYRQQIHYNKIITCHLHMSERTYFYKREKIVEKVAEELGLQ
jgi:RinA family phage transcriptional activator